jgi:hypothetical protein
MLQSRHSKLEVGDLKLEVRNWKLDHVSRNSRHLSLVTRHSSRLTRYSLLITLLLTLIQPTFASPPSAIPDRRFGAVDTFDSPKAATQLGAGWTRVRFPWATLQPNNDGEWNNAFFTDDQLAVELNAGREVAGLIVNTPPWALQDGGVPGVPSGLYLRDDDPNNVWATFVRQIVSRYAGRINHWIIWNEPDIWDANYPGRTWGGDAKDFFQLMRVAYNVIKATNPNAIVHLSAFTYFWDANYGRTPFMRLLLDEMVKDQEAAAHNYYFDIASANLYFQTDNIYDLVAWTHQQMIDHGFDKPLWLTETNAAPSNDPTWPVAEPKFSITLDEQASFIIQSFAMALAAGANRVAIYKMADVPGDHAANPEPFGLVREDGSHRPAFAAFQVAANYLAGFTSASLEHRDAQYTVVSVKRGNAWTTVAWTRQPSPVKISVTAHAASALLIDANGRKQTIKASNGQYAFDIAGATCTGGCIIGGSPRLIVEGSSGVSIAPPGPQPIGAPTSTISASNDATPNGTPTLAGNVATEEPTKAGAPNTATPTSTSTATPTSTSAPTSTPTSTSTATPTATATATPTSTPSPTPTPGLPILSVSASDNPFFITIGILIGALIVGYIVVRVFAGEHS